ncbi:hypothetical protein pb186bvf_017148 [Paramecium bursaria]
MQTSQQVFSIIGSEQFTPQEQQFCENCKELNRSYRNLIESEKQRFENQMTREMEQLKKQLLNEQQERLRLESIVQTQSDNTKQLEDENLQLRTNYNACKKILKRDAKKILESCSAYIFNNRVLLRDQHQIQLLNQMSLILINGQLETKQGNTRADIQDFIEEMSNDHPYLKYICASEKINSQHPDFSQPIYFFNYLSLQSIADRIESNINRINNLQKDNLELKELQNFKKVDQGEQEIYLTLYEETQEKLSQKIIEFEQLQTQYSALENQQSEILKKTQQNSIGICQQCINANQKLDKIKQDNLRLTQNITHEQNKYNKLQQDFNQLQSQIQELERQHQEELQKQLNNEQMKYIEQLNKTKATFCKPCSNKQIQIEDLENKIKLNEQYQNNRTQEYEKRIKQREDEMNDLKKQLTQNKLVKCQCLEKDQRIQQLQSNISDLEQRQDRVLADLQKLKKDYDNTKYDLSFQTERNATLQKQISELNENLKKQEQNSKQQKEVIQNANKQQQKCQDQLLQQETNFQETMKEKINIDKELSQQLQNLTVKDQEVTLSALKKYIQNQDKNYNIQYKEYIKFKDDFKLQMNQLAKQALKSSILIQQRYQQ